MQKFTIRLCHLVLAAAALALALGPYTAAAAAQTELYSELPTIIDAAGIPGVSIAVVKGGDITAGSFGVREHGTNDAITNTTAFEAASLTKPVFAYAVLRLVDRGQLDLDRPLTDYVAFPDVEGDDRVNDVTARIVLSHTTGFPNWSRSNPLTIGPDPGTTFGYSGEGFVFLQKAVEAITGQTGAEFVSAELLEPLGMTSSYLVWDDVETARTAVGHDFIGTPQDKWQPDAFNAASSLHTTATDYARFLAEVMEPTLVSSALVEEMLTPESNVTGGVFWGLGWGLEQSDTGSEIRFWHWGNNGWFKCFTLASPETGTGLIFFTNSENGLSITNHVVERVFSGTHPALEWKQFTAYDAPAFAIERALAVAGIDGGADGVRSEHTRLLETYRPADFEENMMNNLGYRLMRMEAAEAGVEVFRLNAQAYPESWNVFDSLGEGLAQLGDTTAAIASYERSLELNPENTNGRNVLDALRGVNR
jgi:CubicO group peptidase (beta-lactamase class C family)